MTLREWTWAAAGLCLLALLLRLTSSGGSDAYDLVTVTVFWAALATLFALLIARSLRR